MLEKYADRSRTFFAADYEPQLGNELADVAKEIRENHKPDSVKLGTKSYNFGWPSKRQVCILNPTRIALQTLGLSAWKENQSTLESMIRAAVKRLGIDKFKRLGFKVSTFIPLSMTHAEMCELMFGSFLSSKDKLEQICGRSIDPLVQIEGEHGDMRYILVISPMTAEQITRGLSVTPNLDLFLEDKYLDTGVKDFLGRVQQSDAFHFDIDLFRRDVGASTLKEFLKSSMEKADLIAEACVRNLQSKPIERK
jgi:hypothetical protein